MDLISVVLTVVLIWVVILYIHIFIYSLNLYRYTCIMKMLVYMTDEHNISSINSGTLGSSAQRPVRCYSCALRLMNMHQKEKSTFPSINLSDTFLF